MEESCCKTKIGQSDGALRRSLVLYKPLIVIFLLSVAMASALHLGWNIFFMDTLMGMFLCFLATLKFFDLSGFAKVFSGYDLVARRVRGYGLAYPFIELILGLLYLSAIYPVLTNTMMLIVMIVSNAGVVQVIRTGRSVECACAGAAFSLPVGRVTLFENTAMALMATINLISIF